MLWTSKAFESVAVTGSLRRTRLSIVSFEAVCGYRRGVVFTRGQLNEWELYRADACVSIMQMALTTLL